MNDMFAYLNLLRHLKVLVNHFQGFKKIKFKDKFIEDLQYDDIKDIQLPSEYIYYCKSNQDMPGSPFIISKTGMFGSKHKYYKNVLIMFLGDELYNDIYSHFRDFHLAN